MQLRQCVTNLRLLNACDEDAFLFIADSSLSTALTRLWLPAWQACRRDKDDADFSWRPEEPLLSALPGCR
jgi:hypothetical protein